MPKSQHSLKYKRQIKGIKGDYRMSKTNIVSLTDAFMALEEDDLLMEIENGRLSNLVLMIPQQWKRHKNLWRKVPIKTTPY